MSSGDVPRLLRTVDDEEADRLATLHNLTTHVFEAWPTEAGFDGLCEERGPIELAVHGSIPPWAAGHLYRTGPGQCKINDTPRGTHYISHWFDGLAHSHRFEIVAPPGPSAPVRVLYSSRRQSEPVARLIQRQGPASLFSFAQRRDPCLSLLGKCMSTFRAAVGHAPPRPLGSENVSVVVLADVPQVPGVGVPDRPMGAAGTASPGHRPPPANIWITTDANLLRQVDPLTLEPVGFVTQEALHPDLRGPFSAAHAQRDPQTGDVYNFNLDLGPHATYRVFRVAAATGTTTILATIRCAASAAAGPRPAYIHSFFLTAHYVVLCIPCSHVAANGLRVLWEHNIADGIVPFDPALQTRWLVIDRRPDSIRGIVAEFVSDPCFFFHSVNAYESDDDNDDDDDGHDGTSIVCDVVDYPSFDIVRTFYYDVVLNRHGAASDLYADPALASRVMPTLTRYRLRLPSASVKEGAAIGGAAVPSGGGGLVAGLFGLRAAPSMPPAPFADRLWAIPGPHCGELPTINPAYATHRHRFVYGIGSRGFCTLADGLVKVDTVTRNSLLWPAPPTDVPGEAIFVPRPRDERNGEEERRGADADTDEDDGVLLSVVLDGQARASYLLCLDARTMTELGRADVGFAVGFGFHGIHTNGRPVSDPAREA